MHSEKQNPASKPQTKNMLNAGLKRSGNPAYVDHAPSNKLTSQSSGARRCGDNSRSRIFQTQASRTPLNRPGKIGRALGKGLASDRLIPTGPKKPRQREQWRPEGAER